MPVWGAAEELERCLASVLRETDLTTHGLILVIDGPQSPEVESVVGSFDGSGSRILRNEKRLGFAASVNRGMDASVRDVVLLNSDTIVTPRWLEKLIDASESSGDVGTVTPLSNHATLCSVPRGFEENLIPSGHSVNSFAALVERVSKREYPRLPTGVGVCLLIRRALLDEIGLFDSDRFAAGYGEENDFCMRALARGWVHVADDATFIAHAGGRSFGPARQKLQRRAARTLARLHPAYISTIAAFMDVDPLAAVRERIALALRRPKRDSSIRSPKRVTHVIHGWPPFHHAGAEMYGYWLVRQQLKWRDVSVFARMSDLNRKQYEAVELTDEGARVRLITNNFTQRDPFSRNAIRDRTLERAFARFLRQEKPELIHVHHLAGHAFSLAGVARRFGAPLVYQVQDWWSLCRRANMFDFRGRRCTAPGLSKCATCAPLTGIAPAAIWNPLLHLVRRKAARAAFSAADAHVMGSQFIRNDYERWGLLPEGERERVFVVPYGVDTVHGSRVSAAKHPLRFGFIGSILPHKGLHVAVEAFREIDPSLAVLRAWGDGSAMPEYTQMLLERGGSSFELERPFSELDKPGILASIDVLLVPSIGLESFGLAAREAMAAGIPVIASEDGALTEMFPPESCGELFPAGDVSALQSIIRRLIDSPSIVDRWSAAIPRVKSMEEHAEEIEEVYQSVLRRPS